MKDKKIKKAVDEIKATQATESMADIFNLTNKQTFSKETKPEERNGVRLWGSKNKTK